MSSSEEHRPTVPHEQQPAPGERFCFPKQVRLRTKSDFDRVYRGDHAYSRGPLFNVLVAANQRDYSRLGLSVSRHVGNAVVRNRWKRLLRESFRLMRSRLPAGIDIIVIPNHQTPPPPLAVLLHSFQASVRRAEAHLKPKRRNGAQDSGNRPLRPARKKKRKRR